MAKAERLSSEELSAVREKILREGGLLFVKACPVPGCHSVVALHEERIVCLTCGWTRRQREWGEESVQVSSEEMEGLGREEFRDLVLLFDPTRWKRLAEKARRSGKVSEAEKWERIARSISPGEEYGALVETRVPRLPRAPQVVVFTDGGCDPNPGPGAWACILIFKDQELELAGRSKATTNNRMELTAAIMGLRAIRKPSKVTVVTDSQYVYYGMTDWITNWSKNLWRRKGAPLPNKDLWIELAKEALRHETSWSWTRGHIGVPENERCDRLAASFIDPKAQDDQEILHKRRLKRREELPEIPKTPTAPIWLPKGSF